MGGRRDERMCFVSLSPFRPTLALLFNFPQDNNPMTTTLTITENERGGSEGEGTDGRRMVAGEGEATWLTDAESITFPTLSLSTSLIPPLSPKVPL